MKQPRRIEAPEFRVPLECDGTVVGRALTDGKLELAIEWAAGGSDCILNARESAALRNQLSRFGDWARLHEKRDIQEVKSCPNGLLPDGPVCPRCGRKRGPSGLEHGSWVHIT